MKPLSVIKRRVYLGISSILFLLCIPVLILYATGYRFNNALSLIETGGVFVALPYSGTDVYVGGELVKQNGVFQKNAFVQNLRPGKYTVKVEKKNYQTWSKELTVFPQTVTESYPFLFLEKPLFTEVLQFGVLQSTSTATGTKSVTQGKKETSEYTSIVSLFKSALASSTATSTDVLKIRRKLSVENKKGMLHVVWTGDNDALPHYFCENEVCKEEITIRNTNPIISFDFLPGRDDLIIFSTQDGIFVSEIDNRSKQNVDIVKLGKKLDVRVKTNDTVYIKNNKQYFSVSY